MPEAVSEITEENASYEGLWGELSLRSGEINDKSCIAFCSGSHLYVDPKFNSSRIAIRKRYGLLSDYINN